MSLNSVKEFPLEEEYKKPTGIRAQDISALREWLQTQPHLPGEHITELDLILAYHCCNRSTELTKQVVDLHYTLKTLFVTFFKDRVVDERVEKALNTALMQPLPTRTKDGFAVFYSCLIDLDSKNYIVADLIRTTLMAIDLWQFEEGTWPGAILVLDMAGGSVSHLLQWHLQLLQQTCYFLQEAVLLNLKGIHFINAPPFMDKVMMLLRPFFKKDMMENIVIHPVGSNSLNKYFPIEGLPKEAGGKYKTQQDLKEEALNKLRANQAFFDNESKKRVLEALRPGKTQTITDLFGCVEGSFKKLEID